MAAGSAGLRIQVMSTDSKISSEALKLRYTLINLCTLTHDFLDCFSVL